MKVTWISLNVFFISACVSMLYLAITDLIQCITVAIALGSFVVAFFARIIQPLSKESVLKLCYERLETCHGVENPQKPLLKALIKMRLENPEFDLEQIYNMSPSMFSKEKLLNKLYS